MIWLIGNRGMLGSDVEIALKGNNVDYIASDIEVDITDLDTLKSFINSRKIDWLINCSAYTAVDKAEDEPEEAFKINASGVSNIAKIAQEIGARLIHISTDYVFNGEKEGAYTEEEVTDPVGVYGKSKLEGEKNIQKTTEEYFIIRTAWLYGIHGHNFVYTMLRMFKERLSVRIVADQWGSPTYTEDLASVILKIVKDNSRKYGIYHFTNEGKTSWYDFAKEIYKRAKDCGLVERDVEIVPVKTQEFQAKAMRPRNSYLSKEKIEAVFHINIRKWQDTLEDFFYEIKDRGIEV